MTALTMKHVAVGRNEWNVWLLDSNGHVWSPVQSIETGDYVGWGMDQVASATGLAVDGNGTVWAVNAEGRIFTNQHSGGLGRSLEWNDDSLHGPKAGPLVKATQIAAGVNVVVAVDEHKRIWTQVGAVRGATGQPWTLNESASSVKCVAVGPGSNGDDIYCINEAGLFYRYNEGTWIEHQIHEYIGGTRTKLPNLRNAASLEMGWDEPQTFSHRNLFYLGTDGYMRESGVLSSDLETFFKDSIARGVDFAVRTLDDIWMVNAGGDVFRRTKKTFTSPLTVGQVTPVTSQSEQYFWTKIKGPEVEVEQLGWTHSVVPGDGLLKIVREKYSRARGNDTMAWSIVDEIVRLNNLSNRNDIKIGQQLKMPPIS